MYLNELPNVFMKTFVIFAVNANDSLRESSSENKLIDLLYSL